MSKLSNGLYYAIEIVDEEPIAVHAFERKDLRRSWDNGYMEATSDGWIATWPLDDDEWDSDQDELRAETERFMVAFMAEEGLAVAEPEPV